MPSHSSPRLFCNLCNKVESSIELNFKQLKLMQELYLRFEKEIIFFTSCGLFEKHQRSLPCHILYSHIGSCQQQK